MVVVVGRHPLGASLGLCSTESNAGIARTIELLLVAMASGPTGEQATADLTDESSASLGSRPNPHPLSSWSRTLEIKALS
jgi:hypothetical protein